MFITPAYAQAAAGDSLSSLAQSPLPMMIIIFVIFYFFMIRPQQKRAKEHRATLEALRRGDQVVTSGGILGKVTRVKEGEDEIEIEIAEGVKVRVVRSTITAVVSKTEPAKDA